ncbi:MAG: hypothetical protein ABJF50_00940 [Paracoccaceae bacterium]
MKTQALAAAIMSTGLPAMADISVTFIEGAPKDRFVIENSACATGPMKLTVDLHPSAGALIFDVTGNGAGVEVFQPFELVSGGSLVTRAPEVLDGDQVLSLNLAGLGPDAVVSFTIDLDDTINAREITVAGSELTGAKVVLEGDGESEEGTFGAKPSLTIPWTDCKS